MDCCPNRWSRIPQVRIQEKEKIAEPKSRYLFLGNRLSDKYKFEKPNDRRALDLMNAAAVSVMKDLPDLIIAYGVSDEYRFVKPFKIL